MCIRDRFDVRLFNPTAKVYLTSDLPAAYRRNELEKKRMYGRRVRMVDQASFRPLVFSCLGEMGKESLFFYKRLSNSLAEKRNQEYSVTANWLRSRLSFCMHGPRRAILSGGANIFEKNVAHHGWATKKIFHFLRPQNTLKRYLIGENNSFLVWIWPV